MSRTSDYGNGVYDRIAGRCVGTVPIAAGLCEPGIFYYDTASNDNTLYYWDPERQLFLTTTQYEFLFFHDLGGAATLQLKMETAAFTTSEVASIGFSVGRRAVVTDMTCTMPAGGPYTCTIQARSQAFGGAAATVGTLDFVAQNVNSRVDVNSANRIASNDILTARVSSGTAGPCFLRVGLRGYHEAA